MENVIIKNDDSVDKKIEKTAKRLKKRYSASKREVSEEKLKKRTPLQKTISVISDVVCVLLILICGSLCFSVVNARLQGVTPTYMGYSVLKVSSGSMTASGFEVGDYISVRKVDTKTLKRGNLIAFYVYSGSYNSFDINTCSYVYDEDISDLAYDNSASAFFGLQSSSIITAVQGGATLVFHEIINVVEDPSGTRWFTTKGSSNGSADSWFISEDMVVGAYTGSGFSSFVATTMGYLSNSTSLILLVVLIPVILLAWSMFRECSRDMQIAFLENDVVRGKRKLTDEICVKNKIGTKLSKKEKYKVLAQAKPEEKNEYINLLWDGKKPVAIQKHYARQRLMLREYEEKLKLHEECEKMLSEGVSMNKIAIYYDKERKKIEKNQQEVNKKLKNMRKQQKAS